MQKEILNIEYHTLRILVKVLNKCRSVEQASRVTKMPPSSIFNLMRRHNIKCEKTEKGIIRVVHIDDLQYVDNEGCKVVSIPII